MNKIERRKVMKFFAWWFICLLFAMMLGGCMMAPAVVADKDISIGDNTSTAGNMISLADISTRK